ncbi:uncharacterized protein LOC113495752 [Trichoplusia ni]|uniref:Uncharacterized protein LOC113495752 n=1 Tax=Trichoplusia ni TaxID=7111 RepID=A0A7E5VQM4_TRINI|nr:uncharacterized protein LOC113495752 [Trichoplusia ni]
MVFLFGAKVPVNLYNSGYKIVQSQKGKSLILYRGNTYAKSHRTVATWVCSTHTDCKAKLKLNKPLGRIIEASVEHNHPVRKLPDSKIASRERFDNVSRFYIRKIND